MATFFTESFGSYICEGDTIECEHEGFTLKATIHRDDTSDAPWDREDGHGPVSDWRSGAYADRPSKAPGERLLHGDRFGARFYDFAAAVALAKREWIAPSPKAGQRAAEAAEADFKRLKAWCNDEWFYVGVSVTVERAGVELVGKFEHALWGIESDAGDYLVEVADELADEALAAAKAKLLELAA